MDTRILSFSNPDDVQQVVKWIHAGEVVAFPTETVYGLGADAFNPSAVHKVFAAKGRPADNPLIVHLSDIKDLRSVVDPACVGTEAYRQSVRLGQAFWPGPLSILFPKLKGRVPDVVTAGLGTVVLVVCTNTASGWTSASTPHNSRVFGVVGHVVLPAGAETPIAAPSANLSGRPSPTTAAHVMRDLGGRIPGIVEGGCSSVGVESTVVDLFRSPPCILRPGGVTLEQLRAFVPNMAVFGKSPSAPTPSPEPPPATAALAPATTLQAAGGCSHCGHPVDEAAVRLLTAQRHRAVVAADEVPSTPGMKYQHYCPEAPVVLLDYAAMAPAVSDALPHEAASPAQGGSTPELFTPAKPSMRDALAGLLQHWLARHGGIGGNNNANQAILCNSAAAVETIERADEIGVMLSLTPANALPTDLRADPHVHVVATGPALADVQHLLFGTLRALDGQRVGCIIVEGVPERAEGLAIMNRLRKAATHLVPVAEA